MRIDGSRPSAMTRECALLNNQGLSGGPDSLQEAMFKGQAHIMAR